SVLLSRAREIQTEAIRPPARGWSHEPGGKLATLDFLFGKQRAEHGHVVARFDRRPDDARYLVRRDRFRLACPGATIGALVAGFWGCGRQAETGDLFLRHG